MAEVPNNDQPPTSDPRPPVAGSGFVRFRDISPPPLHEGDEEPEASPQATVAETSDDPPDPVRVEGP